MPPHHHPPHHPPHHGHHYYSSIVMPPLEAFLEVGTYEDVDVAEAMHEVLNDHIPPEWVASMYFRLGFEVAAQQRMADLDAKVDDLRSKVKKLSTQIKALDKVDSDVEA